MASSDFSDLLLQAEKLTANIEGESQLPKVERSLGQVLEASKELYTRVAGSETQDVHANLLLGSQGIDLQGIVHKLKTISAKRTLDPIEPIVDSNVVRHLDNDIKNIIFGALEEEFKRNSEITENNAWEYSCAEWNQEKLELLNTLTTTNNDILKFTRPASVFVESLSTPMSLFGNEGALYAAKVAEYCKSILGGVRRINLVQVFSEAAKDFKDTKVNDMWEMINYMTNLPPFPISEDVIKTRNNAVVIKSLIQQAKNYLEDRYKTYMSNIINENFTEARRGGVPGTYSLAKSYVGIRFHGEYAGLQDGVVEDRPIWPVVYYCLRSGDLSAAVHCLKKSTINNKAIIDLLEMKFKSPDSREIVSLESSLQAEYRRLTFNSTDPFKRIVYDLLCFCNTADEHTEVTKTADDYLWLKLSRFRINSDHDDSNAYRELQALILEDCGETHYNAVKQPHLYFQMLILTGQFEAAFEFLARTERYQIHGVHMAIALNELHMLSLPRYPSSALLSSDYVNPKPAKFLNIARLVMIYVEKFEKQAIPEAVNYFYMLRNILNEDNQNVFITSVIDLAIATLDYKVLFGEIQPNGVQSRGYLHEFSSTAIRVDSIAQQVGYTLNEKGLQEEAIDLYDIANNQEEVLTIMCSLLSQTAPLQPAVGSLRNRLMSKMIDITNRYSSSGYNCSAATLSAFNILKGCMLFFDEYHSKEFALALKTLENLQIVPLRVEEIEEKVNAVKRFSGVVCRVLPDVVLATMNMLFAHYQKLKANLYSSQFQDTSPEKQLEYLRMQAKTIISFTGMLPYRMPGDTNSRMVQMEILMH